MTADMWTDKSRARRGLTLWDNYVTAGDRQNSSDERDIAMTDNDRVICYCNARRNERHIMGEAGCAYAEESHDMTDDTAPRIPVRQGPADDGAFDWETDQTAGHPDHDGLRAQSLDHWTCAYCDARDAALNRANEARLEAGTLADMADNERRAAAAIGFGSDRASRLQTLAGELYADANRWDDRAMEYDTMARIPAALRSAAVTAALDELSALQRNPVTFAYYVTEATRETVRRITGLGFVPMLGTVDRWTREDIDGAYIALVDAVGGVR